MPYKDPLKAKEYQAKYQKQWAKNNLEKRRKYTRMSMQRWRDENPELSAEKMRDWRRLNKKKSYTAVSNYKLKNPEKAAAHKLVLFAKKNGTLIQLPCQVCGNVKSQAHHEDYSKPLEVIWLCQKHHSQKHKAIRL